MRESVTHFQGWLIVGLNDSQGRRMDLYSLRRNFLAGGEGVFRILKFDSGLG
jgi:hypothetical protein